MNTASKTRHVFILFLADIVWGIAFVAQSKGGDAVGAFSFNGIRFLIGALCLLPVIKILDKKELTVNRPESKKQKKELWIAGSCCGIALFFASNLQQLGISMGAESGKAGFLTATYILMVPILGIFLKRKCGVKIWIGVFIALIGMYFLCMNGAFSLSGSDLLLLAGALCFAIQILVIDHFSAKADGIWLSCIQFATAMVITGVIALIAEKPQMSQIMECFWPLMYMGVFSSGVAYTLQIVGQKYTNPTMASMIMSLESVFAVLGGMVLLREIPTIREAIGCTLMFVAIIIPQLPERN